MKLLIIGQGRHGKDSFAEIANKEFNLTFSSSSEVASKLFIYPALKDMLGYQSEEECYLDRHTDNHRQLWYELIRAYGYKHHGALIRACLAVSDMYIGMRAREEFEYAKTHHLFDHVIYIDAEKRLGKIEDTDSNCLTKEDASIILDNNGTYEEFKEKVIYLLHFLLNK